MDPLRFAYQPGSGLDDAIHFLLDRSLSQLRKSGRTVGIMLFDFSGTFITIQHSLLGDRLDLRGMDQHLMSWILDYLTNWLQYVRTQDCVMMRGPHREQSWPLSCSPCTPQTSTTDHSNAFTKVQDFPHPGKKKN